MISFDHFRGAMAWLAAQPDLMAELDSYKNCRERWSRKATGGMCVTMARKLDTYWGSSGYDQVELSRIFTHLRTAIHSYIHADDPNVHLTHQKTLRDIYKKYRQFELLRIKSGRS